MRHLNEWIVELHGAGPCRTGGRGNPLALVGLSVASLPVVRSGFLSRTATVTLDELGGLRPAVCPQDWRQQSFADAREVRITPGLDMPSCKVRTYRPWEAAEEEALRVGVQTHGLGAWQSILQDPRFSILEGRNGIQLKDKWRNLVKFNHVSPAEAALAVQKASNKSREKRTPGKWEASLADGHLFCSVSSDSEQPEVAALNEQESPGSPSEGTDEDTCTIEASIRMAEANSHFPVSLWPTGLPSYGLAASVALRSLHGLAGQVISQQRQHAEQLRAQCRQVASTANSDLPAEVAVINAMEVALEAHEIQLEANRQLTLVIKAAEEKVPGMNSWMRNAVHVAQYANEKAAQAWNHLHVAQQRVASSDCTTPDLSVGGEHSSPPSTIEDADENLASGHEDDNTDEDEAAAEVLSALQSGAPFCRDEYREDCATTFEKQLSSEELQRWVAVVEASSTRKKRKGGPRPHDKGVAKSARY